jgi:hypothetical protein
MFSLFRSSRPSSTVYSRVPTADSDVLASSDFPSAGMKFRESLRLHPKFPIPFGVRSFLLYLMAFLFCFSVYEYRVNRWPCSLSPDQIDEFGFLMKEFHRTMETNQIPYVLMEGTLLGAIRDGLIIPWTDDVDVAVHHSDADRATEAIRGNPAFVIPSESENPEKRVHRFYSRKYWPAFNSLWHQIWNKAIYVDVSFIGEDYKPFPLDKPRKIMLNGELVWAPSEPNTHQLMVDMYGADYMTPQDPACDRHFCFAQTPVACRRYYPLIWPALITAMLVLWRPPIKRPIILTASALLITYFHWMFKY